MEQFQEKVNELFAKHETLLSRKNIPLEDGNGIFTRYQHPVLTAAHTPIFWRYDLNEKTNPYLMERIGMNATMNSGAIKWNGKYILMVRVEGSDRKSFFAVAESPNGIDNFRFWDYPVTMPDDLVPATNIYDMRLTAHEDGWVYGIFCAERHDANAAPGDLSSATATAAIARTKDLKNWERLPDLKTKSQQRNVVLHPEFVNGKYALYTRPQDGFIDAGSGGGIGWALVDDITHAEVKEENIIDPPYYPTIKGGKKSGGPPPTKKPNPPPRHILRNPKPLLPNGLQGPAGHLIGADIDRCKGVRLPGLQKLPHTAVASLHLVIALLHQLRYRFQPVIL